MSTPHPDDLRSLRQVATHAAVSPCTARRWIAAGALAACTIGRTVRIRRGDLDRSLRRH